MYNIFQGQILQNCKQKWKFLEYFATVISNGPTVLLIAEKYWQDKKKKKDKLLVFSPTFT